MKLLSAVSNSDIFGKISPPPGSQNLGVDPVAGVTVLITQGIRLFILLCAIALLIYLLWGAWDWITSGGQKEMIEKAKQKITNAIIGIFLVFLALTVFTLVTQRLLKITDNNGGFVIPKFNR
jgi:hypothetical protein